MGLFSQKETKVITRAKVIGVRTAEESKTLVTYNFGVYSFLVEYDDGTHGIIESNPKAKDWESLMAVLAY